jgi:hypothetical protein
MSRSMNRRAGVAALLCLLATLPLPLAAQARAGGSTTLTLDEAVRTALERNRDVREARDGLEVARKQVTEAWGSVYPSLSLNASYTRNVSPAKSFLPAIIFDPEAGPDDLIAVQFGADNQWTSTLSLDQPLFQAQAFIGVGAASRFQALQEEVLRGRARVVTRVRLAYYDLLLAQEERTSHPELRGSRPGVPGGDRGPGPGRGGFGVRRAQTAGGAGQPGANATAGGQRRDPEPAGPGVELDLGPGVPDQVVLAGSLASLDLADPAPTTPRTSRS